MPRSGSNLLKYTLRRYLSKFSPDEYITLGEFFNIKATRSWFTNFGDHLIRHGRKKPNLSEAFTLKYVYKDNLLFKERDYEANDKFDYDLEKNRLLEIWNESQKDDDQKYILKLFPHHISPDFVTKLNTDDTFFIVLWRKDFRKMILSMAIANEMDKWAYKDTEWEQYDVKRDFPERNSINVDMNIIELHLTLLEEFYKNIEGLNNKFILNYSDIGNTETMLDLMQHIHEDDILENEDMEYFENFNTKVVARRRTIPTPYTMDHIDYFKNKDEILTRFEKFDKISDYYTGMYGIE